MRRSTFVLLGVGAFTSILATFVVRGTTRLIVGDRVALLLAAPLAVLSLALVVLLLLVAAADLTGLSRMEDDLAED